MTSKPHYKITNDGNRIPFSDGLKNVYSGLNTGGDQRTYNRYVYSKHINHTELEALYRDGGIAAKIVDIPADDATREWRTFNGDNASDIAEEEKRHQVQQHVNEGIKYSRLFGGSLILMLTGQNLSKPLDINKIKKGDLKSLIVLDRWSVSPQNINITNPLSSTFMMPEFYTLVNGSTKIHHSHFVRFDGVKLPRRLMMLENSWGDSQLRRALDDVYDYLSVKGGVAGLMNKANQDVVKRPGLFDQLTSKEDDKIIKRYQTFKLMMSNLNLALLDGEEEFERHSLSFTGIADMQREMKSWVSSVGDIPVTRLFGESAKGLNATGEGDLKNYYDSIRGKQESEYRQAMERLDQVLIRSALGTYPDGIEFEWNPLYQESGNDLAQQRLANSQTDLSYVDASIVRRSQVMRRLKENGEYAITDEQIKQMEKREEQEAKNAENGMADPDGSDFPDFESEVGGGDQGAQQEEESV